LKPKLTIVLMLIVITPLAIAGWLGVRIVRDEQVVVEHQFRELIESRLRSVDAELLRRMDEYGRTVLTEMTPFTVDRDELRRRTRESPYVLQYYVVDAEDRLLFPPIGTPAELTSAERQSLLRTRRIWESGAVVAQSSPGEVSATTTSSEQATGWHVWYWGDGLQWMLWAREGGRVHAAEINRTRLLAELIGSLPETDVDEPELAEGRIRLLASAGRALYQWGSFEAAEGERPVATIALGAPLGGWSLEHHASGAIFGSAVAGSLLLNLTAGLAVLAVAVVGLTYYFYREQSREMREAAQRVSFVNQVSHELKTPLTNIRMYAELLEEDVDEQDDRSRRHLGVIVTESQRLSRLIGNVLTFGRKQRGVLELHRRPGIVDDVLDSVLRHFRPALDALGIQVDFVSGAQRRVSLDPDAVEQIVGNLVSNVEKYGANGKHLTLVSRQHGDTVEIIVADQGPGVASDERQRIFESFYRVSSSLTEGVSGAGIGLAISRELARLHGGDLELESSGRGARFRLTLECPSAEASA
jgi:signal transduction histidine kinase